MSARRLVDRLPAIYRGGGDDLRQLLSAFEAMLFVDPKRVHDGDADARPEVDASGGTGGDAGRHGVPASGGDAGASVASLPGIESRIDHLPALFAPLGSDGEGSPRTPPSFLPWIASWLAFTPHRYFEPEQLRRIVAGIVPLYGLRGTRAYMQRLLELCFGGDVASVRVDERAASGLTLGRSRIGIDSLLALRRPFWFGVDVELHHGTAAAPRLEQRLRAVIDFAKPAHTAYDLRMRAGASEEDAHS